MNEMNESMSRMKGNEWIKWNKWLKWNEWWMKLNEWMNEWMGRLNDKEWMDEWINKWINPSKGINSYIGIQHVLVLNRDPSWKAM